MQAAVGRFLVLFGRWPRPVQILTGLGLVAVVGLTDYVTGREISLAILYLLPVSLVAWSCGRRLGAGTAFLCSVAWLIADLSEGATVTQIWHPYWNAAVRLGMFLVVGLVLARLRRALDREIELARVDSLTGLANSRAFFEMGAMTIASARRRPDRCLTLVYVDVDDFKDVNDSHGHEGGDQALQRVAVSLRRSVRQGDILARLGGDEFAVLLDARDAEEAAAAMERLQASLRAELQAGPVPLSVSVGAVSVTGSAPSLDELIRMADELMYEVKRSGKDRVRHEFHDAAPSRVADGLMST